MSSLKDIYRKNEETFYDYNSGNKVSTLSRKAAEVALAAILAFIYFDFTDNFINGIITVYSILAGFGLNILFFLMGADGKIKYEKNDSIERILKIDKVNKISKELFYNVSYFIVLSVILVLLCLVYYGYNSSNIWLMKEISRYISQTMFKKYFYFIDCGDVRVCATYIFNTSLLFFLIESIFSFGRTIFRVSFYFDRRLGLLNGESS